MWFMKLNNLLINSSGRILISDFGNSKFLMDSEKVIYIAAGGSIGGNPVCSAPEIRKINTSLSPNAVKVDYSKQTSFELGMVAFEIFFGDIPESLMFGEHMDNSYFNNLCVDDSHKIPEMFEWLRDLLYSDPQRRTSLLLSISFNKISKSVLVITNGCFLIVLFLSGFTNSINLTLCFLFIVSNNSTLPEIGAITWTHTKHIVPTLN